MGHSIGRTAALVWVGIAAACGSRGNQGSLPPPTAAALPTGDVLLELDSVLDPHVARGSTSGAGRHELEVEAGARVRIIVTSTAFDPLLEVTPPGGAPLTNDDVRGDRTRSEIEFVATVAGPIKIRVRSLRPDAAGAYHLRVERVRNPPPPLPRIAAAARRHHLVASISQSLAAGSAAAGAAPPPTPVQVGDRLRASIDDGDVRLESGELADIYLLELAAPTDLTIQMQSSRVDSYLVVTGPGGAEWENDDSHGTRDATVAIAQAPAGRYRIVATTYRAGEVGPYELKVLGGRDTAAAAAGGGAPTERVIEGSLAPGDRVLASGEFFDEHNFTWPVGTPVRLEARSREFDTYLILVTPSGDQRDNDDQAPGVLDAAMDFVVQEAGAHRVLVTSYRPGETGHYQLVVGGGAPGGAPSPATPPGPPSTASAPAAPSAAGRTITGRLEPGDQRLRTGEWMDAHTASFPPGAPVSIRLESSEFDTYLIVRSPSGRQEDNDDLRPGVLNSGIDIPAAEPGNYVIIVTSYRPGETGAYTLHLGGPAVDTGGGVPGPGGVPPAAPGTGGSRVWVLSVGISDYPGSANDLPECANDAIKIAEALRNQGLTAPDREFLFTDARATLPNIRDAIQRIASQIRPDDTFVFFYSGHGGQNEGRSNDSRELDGIDEYLFLYDGPLMDDDLGRLFDQIHARTSLAAIDACYSGGFAKDLITRPGVVGMFSSEEDVTSAVALQFQAGGYLSHFLRLGIQGEADTNPRDRVMTVGELTHYVWQQYGRQASDVRMGNSFQHLVIDRGAVRSTQELWRSAR
jgi:hypothetical protein